jgi:hypothetical protein
VNQYYVPKIENASVYKRQQPQAIQQTLFAVMTSALLVAGFLYAIYQHAETVKEGYQTQQLMRLHEQIEREKHQLELQRAYYRSPQVIEPLARRMGLVRPDSSQVIITDPNGEFRRWLPPLKRAENERVVHVSRASATADALRTAMTSLPSAGSKIAESDGQSDRNGTAPAVRTRPRRVVAAEAGTPTRTLGADTESTAHVEGTPPQAQLEGVLQFPVGQAELKLEKTRKRQKR